MIPFSGFEWDSGNSAKNWRKHRVSKRECEEVFAREPLVILEDISHSIFEQRMIALGNTKKERKLTIAFTFRNGMIRVISARPMSKKERALYEK
jgi:uncharacterized DUF497 family protein